MFNTQSKSTRYMKKNENVIHTQARKKSKESDIKMTQMLTLGDNDFKATIIIILKWVEKYMIKINVNIRNLSRELQTIETRTKWKFSN